MFLQSTAPDTAPRARRVRVLAWIFVAWAGPLLAQATPPATPAPTPGAAATNAPAAGAPPAPAATPLSDVVVAAARSDALRRAIENGLANGIDLKALTAPLGDVEAKVEEALRLIRSGEFSALRFDTLVDIDTRIRERERSVGEATRTIGAELARLEREIDRLDADIAAWPARVQTAVDRGAPPEILERVRAIRPELEKTREAVRQRRDALVLAFDRSTQLMSHLDTLRTAVDARRDAIGRELRTAEAAPIWAPAPAAEDKGALKAEFGLARQMLVDYLRSEALGLLLGLVAIAGLVATLLRRLPAEGEGRRRPTPSGAAAAGVLVALVTLAFFAPTGPTAFYPLWWFPTPLIAAWVADRQFAVRARATLWALALAGSVNTFNTLAEMRPGASRVILVAQMALLALALAHDWRTRALDRQLSRWHPITVRMLVIALVATIVASVAANVVGFVGLSRILRGVAVTATSAGMVLAVAAGVVIRAIDGVLAMPIAQRLRGVREQGESVGHFLHAAIVLAAFVAWVLLLIYTQNLVDVAKQGVAAVNDAKISVRDVHVSAGGILLAVLIAVATAIVVRVTRFLLTVEILPRFGFRPGVPFAIATLTGYAIAILGAVLALAALGVDLGRVTLLAGALGVGIGLGLQNVVNNFVSGLILVVERPVKVGDQIEVGQLLGDVRRIGIRSSTVRTTQGAEVIVPNSELVSKEVVNWTLSDRSRRYEIDVGVAYGSDVDRVIRALEEAAASVDEVRKVPPPRVLFAGFGESSLDFRVLAWVDSVDVGLQAQTNLRRAILARLTDDGVSIPYPQRDLHIRTTGPLSDAAPA